MESQERLAVLQGYTRSLVERVFDSNDEKETCYQALDLTHQLKYEDLERYYLNGLDHFTRTIGGNKGLEGKEKEFFENYYYLATIPVASMIMEGKYLARLSKENEQLKQENKQLKGHSFVKIALFALGTIGIAVAFYLTK